MKTKKSPSQQSALRIIGGQWRSRKLPVLQKEGLRPTGDRIRETLFNWLMADVRGARCLDLFAGSGALGLEALSRGAQDTYFIELDKSAAKQIQQNLITVNSAAGRVICGDALAWLSQSHASTTPFDIIFLDPPFAKDLWQSSIEALAASNLVKTSTLIYIEQPVNLALSLPNNITPLKNKTSGQVSYGLYVFG